MSPTVKLNENYRANFKAGMLKHQNRDRVTVLDYCRWFGLDMFLAFIELAGLSDLLSGDENLTVYAPVNEAFDSHQQILEKKDKVAAQRLVLNHVIGTRYKIKSLHHPFIEERFCSKRNTRITMKPRNDGNTINGAEQLTLKNVAHNGDLYLIDAVIETDLPYLKDPISFQEWS